MTQKTVITNEYVEVGDKVLLFGRYVEGGKEVFDISKKLAEKGYPGNQNPDVYAYHGWRGTTNGVAIYAYGVHKVTRVIGTDKIDMDGCMLYKVTVGREVNP